MWSRFTKRMPAGFLLTLLHAVIDSLTGQVVADTKHRDAIILFGYSACAILT